MDSCPLQHHEPVLITDTPETYGLCQYDLASPENHHAAHDAADLRTQAAEHDARAAASFERCDTDGFISQWADGIEASRLRLAAEIAEDGGTAEFPAVFTLDGQYVPARRCESNRYGWNDYWMVLDDKGKATGTFLPYRPTRRATIAKKGYVEGIVREPAKAIITGKGYGLSGSAWAAVVPCNQPYDKCERTIVTADRWEENK